MASGGKGDEFLFGPFRLIAGERLLTRDRSSVDLGGRALDILIALVATPNEVVSKKILMARVWPDVAVEEGSLRFHMTSLRKALGDGDDGARYIATVPGRGYCFVAPVVKTTVDRSDDSPPSADFQYANLPPRMARTIGREDDVTRLSAQLTESRLVTVVGPGGVGKTTVAVAVAHQLAETFAGAVLFVDFGMLSEPRLVATALATMSGLPVQSDDPTPTLVQFLKPRRILLILDTCEHLIDAVADLAMAVMSAAPQTRILATSREALRLDGEHVYRLDSLPCAEDESILASQALQQYAATQLFIERATANGAKLDLDEPAAAIVCDICRKLDGVALAIELAARRVDSYGLEQTAALLDQRLGLLWQGSRSSTPRHKTLHATLDWSYELLSELERAVLRRLTVFVGLFTLDAALEVTSDAKVDRRLVVGAIDSLVEKSMVAARPLGAMMRYRLLDTTRAYALELGDADSEMTPLAARHASYYRRWLERTGNEWSSLSTGMDRAPHFTALNNVRAALNWSFGEFGDARLGIGLAAAAAPVLRAMGLMPECRRWAERALLALDDATRGGSEEMQLQASVGLALMFASGHSDAALTALNRSLDIAEARGDRLNEARLLGPLTFYHLRGGKFWACREYAERCSAIASTLDDPGVSALAHTLSGIAFSVLGTLPEARRELNAALEVGRSPASRTVFFGFDHHHWAEIVLVSTLWMKGYTEQARSAIEQAFKDAEAMQHPVAWAIVLNAVAVLLWVGDLDVAERRLDWFITRARSSSFTPHSILGMPSRASLQFGVEISRRALKPYSIISANFMKRDMSCSPQGFRSSLQEDWRPATGSRQLWPSLPPWSKRST